MRPEMNQALKPMMLKAFLWAVLIAIAHLMIYPYFYKPGEAGCDVPASPEPFSGTDLVNLLGFSLVFFVLGFVIFFTAKHFKKPALAPILMLSLAVIAVLGFQDHDGPQFCNSTPWAMAATQSILMYLLPTAMTIGVIRKQFTAESLD